MNSSHKTTIPGSVVLSPRHVPSTQTNLNLGDTSTKVCPCDKITMEIEQSHDGICRRDRSSAA